ncbi:MAG: TatD family hydrolase [Deltaproteobacteria bacterium]|nr:TatD family hydrolase [Deltaproteobacteria bacterium]MBI2229536.1 TatD family hydrolase [Deltaproteobacteria bacterium]MBI2531452.1 TatD family hydrolase [Deltaproteobacteria bacterium]
MLIDSHAHIQGKEYAGEVEAVIARAREAGVEKIIAVGGAGDMSSNTEAVGLAKCFPGVYATVGMHPHDAKDVGAEELQELKSLAAEPKVIAVGETGLDYYYDHSPREVQRRVFGQFIQLARETDLPVVVHERDAAQDVADLLRTEGAGKLRGVIHCFTGNYEAARAYLDLGFYISFTGIITFKNAEALRDVVRNVPLERMLVETDSPYLTPVPHRGKRNEPAYVRYVGETIASVKALSLDEVARLTTENVRKLFGI